MNVKVSLHGSVTLNRNRHYNLIAFKGMSLFCFPDSLLATVRIEFYVGDVTLKKDHSGSTVKE